MNKHLDSNKSQVPQASIPFSSLDREKISDELRRLNQDMLLKALVGLALAIVFIILPSKHGDHRSMLQRYGFSSAFLLSVGALVWLFSQKYISERRAYTKDLRNGLKIIYHRTIKRKEYFTHQNKYYIWLNEKAADIQRIEIDLSMFNQLHQGDAVQLEFAPHSNFRLEVTWKS